MIEIMEWAMLQDCLAVRISDFFAVAGCCASGLKLPFWDCSGNEIAKSSNPKSDATFLVLFCFAVATRPEWRAGGGQVESLERNLTHGIRFVCLFIAESGALPVCLAVPSRQEIVLFCLGKSALPSTPPRARLASGFRSPGSVNST